MRLTRNLSRFLSLFLAFVFLVQSTGLAGGVSNLVASDRILPAPGTMVALSPTVQPAMLTGVKVYAEEPFRFDFILDKGNAEVKQLDARGWKLEEG